jgi:hypothetical protein
MCDCWQCNQTEEDNDAYIEWMYEGYVKFCNDTDKTPLSINDWLKQFESPIQK